MSLSLNSSRFLPERAMRMLLFKWIVALLFPVAVFTFVWSGETIVNQVLLSLFMPSKTSYDTPTVIQAAIFSVIFYAAIIALAGYLVAADSGRQGIREVWLNILIFALLPVFLIYFTNNLIIGLALCLIVWGIYLYGRSRLRKALHYTAPAPLEKIKVVGTEEQVAMRNRAIMGSFWFATLFAIVSLIADIVFFVTGSPFPPVILLWVILRTLLLPVAGYFLGRLSGAMALRRVLTPTMNGNGNGNGLQDNGARIRNRVSRRRQLQSLSKSRAHEKAKDLVPNDLPLGSMGAQRFYLTILIAFVLFYPVLDPFLFGSGTNGRLSGYGDAGYYVILALGLNIVVGFAGLLDLGYVAFFAIGSYVWAMVGSTQFTVLTHIQVNSQLWPWLFWPMLLVGALIAALWGVVLGIPTLRLRGDYLAIVTLGFGEIIPIFFLNLDKYTNGTNGIVGVYSPKFPGLDWSNFTPIPYYYLILVLIALLIFVNIRLRDSRLGRAWIAIREDEIAASSSGINLVNTKLFAFGAGAFFSGIAGVYHAAKLGVVSPDNFSSSDSIVYLAMVVIGGLGSIPGVIVGAFAVYAVNELILAQLDSIAANPGNILYALEHHLPGFTFGNIRNLIFGIILVAVMVFRPEGLIPSARRQRELHHAEKDTNVVEIGALDAMPGSEQFEEQVQVE